MPVEHSLWKVGVKPHQVAESQLESEAELEDMLCADISILSSDWLLIGRQVTTAYNKNIDLLAIDASGSLIVIELKRAKTPREVVAQAIDYASWVKDLEANDIAEIYEQNSALVGNGVDSFEAAFLGKFGFSIDENDVNSSHQMVIVATELDSSTERIVRYLSRHNIAINAVFFRIFADGDSRYLSRVWFLDPVETLEQATTPRGNEPWNGEFYVSFGHGFNRNWNDAREHNFISAGGGRWYSKTLHQLSKGDRVWVNVPKTGYVGVAIVVEAVKSYNDFMVMIDGSLKAIAEASLQGRYHEEFKDDEDRCEYFVPVNWIKTVELSNAKSEVGFFGNQNTVARPTTPKWPHTVERLKKLFGTS